MTSPRRSHLRALAAVPAVIVALAGCGSDATTGSSDDPGGGALRQATLVLDWTPNTNHGGIYAALAEGFYEDAGIDLEIIQPGEATSLQAVATGNAEFAVSYQEVVIPARANDVPAVSIAAIIEHNTSSLLALAESGISEPGDLAGHTYGGFGGQLETELVDRLVTCGGGDPGTVDHVEVGQTDYRVGLEQGDYDVIWVFDGWDKIRLEQDGVEVNTIPFIEHQECIPDWYTPLIATSESLIADDPELVSDFLEATADGYRLAIDDPGLAADHLLAAAPELDEALVRASAEYLAGRYASEPTSWGRQDRAVWVEFDQFLVDAGLIDDPVDVDAAFTNDLLPGGAS